jgi:hypothetical protein
MTEDQVIQQMRAHLEGQFPKVCKRCHRRFATLREYLLNTQHLGPAMPYDAEAGDWNPLKPLGTMTLALCPCGTTLALTSDGMPLLQLWSLLNWARSETQKRHITPRALLNYLRDAITKQVLAEPEPGPT